MTPAEKEERRLFIQERYTKAISEAQATLKTKLSVHKTHAEMDLIWDEYVAAYKKAWYTAEQSLYFLYLNYAGSYRISPKYQGPETSEVRRLRKAAKLRKERRLAAQGATDGSSDAGGTRTIRCTICSNRDT